MGLNFIGCSSSTEKYIEEVAKRDGVSPSEVVTSPNPNPFRFSINWIEYHGGHTIMSVRYFDCTPFGGNKLLLLRGIHTKDITELDPHFFEGNHPVVARFIPTSEGLRMARVSALTL